MKGGRGDWAFAPTFYSRFTAVSMPSSWMGGRGGEYEGLRRGLKLVNATVDPLKAKQDALNALDLASNALTASNGLITAPGGRVEASKAIKALIETAAHVANKPSEERIEALGEMPEIVRAVLQADDPEKLAAIEGALYAETPGAEWMTALRAFSD